MAAFLLPVAPLLGIDLKYRGCFTFDSGKSVENNSVERHQCLEVRIVNKMQTCIDYSGELET